MANSNILERIEYYVECPCCGKDMIIGAKEDDPVHNSGVFAGKQRQEVHIKTDLPQNRR